MSGASVLRKLRAAAGRFIGAREGNIAVIFALSAIPIISFVGVAIDYTRANAARTAMQAALDSTALMLSKDLSTGTINSSQISTKATAYFSALYNNKDAKNVSVAATYTPSTGATPNKVEINGSGEIITDFMRVAGFPTMGFGSASTTAWGNVRMRVALVLDVTGSMAWDGKMPAMQTAAKDLVDQLSKLATVNGDIYISVVPFAKDVNVGASYYNASWIDWTDWEKVNGTCSNTTYKKKSTCEANGKVWTPKNHNTWTGCLTDRTQDYDTKNTAPITSNTATLFPAEQYSYCSTSSWAYMPPIMPLSYDWTALKAKIDALKPTGNTNQGIGLAWGWMTLTQSDPFNAPAKESGYVYKDTVVLLSDGLNTQNRWYSSSSPIDARQKILCDNAKAANITIYTIQVNTGGDPTSSVLQYCATSTNNFYLVTSASQTASVFKDIATKLTLLRVAK
ncbi:vWA domain-containing protein [Bradyrhizobium sp.]|uniref:vWA domain-containing protein n=1 Tax=Bradyrhizobium sp. TaxID=376 RepID=UPI004037A651